MGGGLVVSGAEDGTLCAWHVRDPVWGGEGGEGGGGLFGGSVVQNWGTSAHGQPPAGMPMPAAGVRSPAQALQHSLLPQQQQQQQQPLQLCAYQGGRAASTCMAQDPVTGVVVSGGHDGVLRAWAPFAV